MAAQQYIAVVQNMDALAGAPNVELLSAESGGTTVLLGCVQSELISSARRGETHFPMGSRDKRGGVFDRQYRRVLIRGTSTSAVRLNIAVVPRVGTLTSALKVE